MSVADSVKAIEDKLVGFGESVKETLEKDLPVVANAATTAESNPLFQVASQALHLPEAPEVLQALAALAQVLDNALGNAKANGAAEATAAAQAAPVAPADPAPPVDPSAPAAPGA